MSQKSESRNGEPRIVILYCQHSVGSDVDIASCAKSVPGVRVRTALMPCSSKVQVSDLLEILDQEADGVEVITCPIECCGLLLGNTRAIKRVEYARSLLDRIGVGRDRLGISHGAGLPADDFVERAAARAKAVINLEENGEDQ